MGKRAEIASVGKSYLSQPPCGIVMLRCVAWSPLYQGTEPPHRMATLWFRGCVESKVRWNGGAWGRKGHQHSSSRKKFLLRVPLE